MKKISAFAITALLAISFFWVSPAVADSRITASVTGKTVLVGSTATMSSTANISERQSTSDWANFKYEIVSVQKSSYAAYVVFNQTSAAPCGGTPGSSVSGTRSCTAAIAGLRSVVYATVAPGTASFSSSLQLTQTAGESQLFRVRSWIDRNNNDSIDAYEPATPVQSINTVHPSQAKAYLNFQVDPPRYSDGRVGASISTTSTSNRFELFDPALISMRVSSCPTVYSCERIIGTTTYNAHPQLLRYEFAPSILSTNRGGYAVELIYQMNLGTSIVLDSRTFDYTLRTPSSVKTEISSSSGTSIVETNIGAGVTPRTRTTLAAPNNASNFLYRAIFSDTDSSLTANRQVFIFIDTKDLISPSSLRVDGIQVSQSTGTQDQIILSRYTDASGVLAMSIQYPGRALEQLRIELQINGMRPYEFAYPGSEEVILWDVIPGRTISLTPSSTSGSSTSPITITANVSGTTGGQAGDGSVLFYADQELTLDNPIVSISPGSSSQSIVRISNFAPPSGTAFVYGQVLSNSGWVTTKLQISWRNYGAQIVIGAFPVEPVLSNSSPASSTPKVTLMTKSSTNYLNISGLLKGDVVVIRKNSTISSPTFSSDYTSATASWQVSKTAIRVSVTVNGKVIFSRITK